MNRGEIRDVIRINLADAGVSYYGTEEINASIQDAYNEIVSKTQCIVKSVTLNWTANKIYYNFIGLNVADYLGVIAIFNNLTNQWLRDDLSLRDFDNLRRDWELWIGSPQFWAPHSLKYTTIIPKPASTVGTYDLWYYATAPTLTADSGEDSTPLIASDMHDLFEYYCTADLLETAEEISKAGIFWDRYNKNIKEYKERCHNLAKSELLLRI